MEPTLIKLIKPLSKVAKVGLLSVCLLLSFFVQPQQREQPEPAFDASIVFTEGVDYRVINPKSDIAASDLEELPRIADLEIFYWYGCNPCYEVELALVDYLSTQSGLNVVRTPLVAHIAWRQQAYLEPLTLQLSEQISVPSIMAFYEACLNDCDVFASFESSKRWIMEQEQLDVLPYIDETAIWQTEKYYRKRADSYSIAQVPTIIIRESYLVDANLAKSPDRLVRIVDYLLNQKNN